jgi:hypothetical protein
MRGTQIILDADGHISSTLVGTSTASITLNAAFVAAFLRSVATVAKLMTPRCPLCTILSL